MAPRSLPLYTTTNDATKHVDDLHVLDKTTLSSHSTMDARQLSLIAPEQRSAFVWNTRSATARTHFQLRSTIGLACGPASYCVGRCVVRRTREKMLLVSKTPSVILPLETRG